MTHISELSQFVTGGHASVIVGGQFGSEAKGLAAAIVAHNMSWTGDMICTTNAGAQAGHTTVLEDGSKFVCYHLPTIGVLRPDSRIYVNAGAIIDPGLFIKEVHSVAEVTGENVDHLMARITIHPAAAIITEAHKEIEHELTRHLGSTRKGIGAALCDKIMRLPGAVANQHRFALGGARVAVLNLPWEMERDTAVTVEIPQGTSLSINSPRHFYPYCTSRDCWVGQGLADAGIPPSFLHHVMMVMRTLPIRVGSIVEEGKLKGYSGDFYSDSQELDWAKHLPGIVPEITTVTKRQRRIATFSANQYEDGLRLNRPTIVLNTFLNYLDELGQKLHLKNLRAIEERVPDLCYVVHLGSTGPKVSDTFVV